MKRKDGISDKNSCPQEDWDSRGAEGEQCGVNDRTNQPQEWVEGQDSFERSQGEVNGTGMATVTYCQEERGGEVVEQRKRTRKDMEMAKLMTQKQED
ncbi:unnamed protein product [Toxocara canis]|uniref:AKAP7 n=1 Tax=Toxocara canis TaxID=6265 RepID=A0A183TYS6_TOXCA|nr:unnamed protein product [Toxocara canis]